MVGHHLPAGRRAESGGNVAACLPHPINRWSAMSEPPPICMMCKQPMHRLRDVPVPNGLNITVWRPVPHRRSPIETIWKPLGERIAAASTVTASD